MAAIHSGSKETDTLQALERAFWFGDADFYRASLTPGCTMVFPGMGIVDRETLIIGIEAGPRWTTVAFEQWRRDDPAPDMAIVAYRAVAAREGMKSPYRAWCGSAYVRADDAWRLAFHQQTAAD